MSEFSQKFWNFCLGFLNLLGLSLNKAQLSRCLDINTDLVLHSLALALCDQCNQTNSNCDPGTFAKWLGASRHRGDDDIVWGFFLSFLFLKHLCYWPRKHVLLSMSATSRDFRAPYFPFLVLHYSGLSGFIRMVSDGLWFSYIPTDAQMWLSYSLPKHTANRW